jgi:hypothetical protein
MTLSKAQERVLRLMDKGWALYLFRHPLSYRKNPILIWGCSTETVYIDTFRELSRLGFIAELRKHSSWLRIYGLTPLGQRLAEESRKVSE